MKKIVAVLFIPLWVLAQVPAVNSGSASWPTTGSISSMVIYDKAGNNQAASHVVKDSCTLSLGQCTVNFTNSSIFTSSSSFVCSANDTSGVAAIASAVPQSGSQIKCFGTGSNVIQFTCIGN